jgi:biopolymer transport protein ExbD
MAVRIRQGTVLQQLPVTPMIDVVFTVLIFFIVATKFAEEERELQLAALPVASEARPLAAEPRDVLISIDAQGHCFVGGKQLNPSELDRLLRTVAATNPGRSSVIIHVDERCEWRYIAPVLNACQRANIHSYRVTVREGPA